MSKILTGKDKNFEYFVNFYSERFNVKKEPTWSNLILHNGIDDDKYYDYLDVIKLELLEIDSSGTKKTIIGGLFAGGLGAIANNLSQTKRHSVFIGLKNGNSITLPCQNIEIAKQIIFALEPQLKHLFQEDKLIDNDIEKDVEKRLIKLKNLLDKGIIDEDDYKNQKIEILKDI